MTIARFSLSPKKGLRPSGNALRHANYRRFFGGQLLSVIGNWVHTIVLGWLIWRLGVSSPVLLGMLAFCSQGPILFFGLFTAFDLPGRQSLVVDLVAHDDLANALALNSVIFNGARLIGPALGGVLVDTVGEGCPLDCGGSAPEFQADQRSDDGLSLCFDTPWLTAPLSLDVAVAFDYPSALLVLQLNEVSADGHSARVTFGVHRLTRPKGVAPGESFRVRLSIKGWPIAFQPAAAGAFYRLLANGLGRAGSRTGAAVDGRRVITVTGLWRRHYRRRAGVRRCPIPMRWWRRR
ncbi:MFS transporter [Sodalis glossinidius]|uniref:MFS transporter n=1 Tax=Sodalis glossinidius TaxID=63612 RepID=UPI0011D05FD8|nr:MFS transporter [Sodalis glossinidius]